MIFIKQNELDSTTVVNLIKYGDVDFSKSDTKRTSCKVYHIDNSYKDRDMELRVENCDSIATVLSINFLNP